MLGGAELSNLQVIRRGVELGFAIKVLTPNNFDRDWLAQCDFIVLNNFYTFTGNLYHFILSVMWEYRKPYVVYSHDHRDIIGMGLDNDESSLARPRFARSLFKHSFLNVFISPMHRDNFLKHLGSVVNPHYILTPPIDTEFFYPRNVTRNINSVVNLTGRLVSSKGLMNVFNWAKANTDHSISVYTKYSDGTSGKLLSAVPNIHVYGPASYELLPLIYSEHQSVMHLPVYPEAAGRTLVEGALCGCSVILNNAVGVGSFSDKELPIRNRKRLVRIIREGPYKFWYNVIKYLDIYTRRRISE